MANQSAAAVTAFRKKLQAATRQAARNPDQLKKTLYGLKNEWVKIVGAYPEVDRVGNAQYLRILLTPGAMQFSGDDVDRYLGDLVGTLGWVERELKTQGKSAKMVIAAAKAVGVKADLSKDLHLASVNIRTALRTLRNAKSDVVDKGGISRVIAQLEETFDELQTVIRKQRSEPIE